MPARNTEPTPPQRPLGQLRPHASAELVPAMHDAEYESFRADIETRSVLVPLEITPDGVVLDGRHRLRAATELGLTHLPVRVVSPEDEHEHVLLAALQRRHLTPSQRAAIAVELDSYREAKARADTTRRANLNGSPEVATLPARGERTREIAARLAGVSARTVQDVATVHEHDAELFAQVKSGNLPAHTAAGKVRRRLRDARIAAAPPLPAGPFELIYADPPWQLGNPDGEHALLTVAALVSVS